MTDSTFAVGAIIAMAGGVIMAFEVVHPGAFLLIPGSILLAGGLLYIALPDFLTTTPYGPLVIALVAVIATAATIPLYKRWGKVHLPMTTMPQSLAGKQGLVIASVDATSLRGKVRVGSEIWSARSDAPIPAGATVKVLGGSGVSLRVALVAEENAAS
ncbi:MAG: NfeD family protein [Thermoplasmata archaeon]|nr:NfeD family protein [Thermoplasmata archaeon]